MSEIPSGTETFGNSPSEIRLRSAANLLRFLQSTMLPTIDLADVALIEYQSVIKIHGALTDEDIVRLGMTAVSFTKLVTFLERLIEFAEKTSAQQPDSYRTQLNSVRRVNAQI